MEPIRKEAEHEESNNVVSVFFFLLSIPRFPFKIYIKQFVGISLTLRSLPPSSSSHRVAG